MFEDSWQSLGGKIQCIFGVPCTVIMLRGVFNGEIPGKRVSRAKMSERRLSGQEQRSDLSFKSAGMRHNLTQAGHGGGT